jgi:hypothetical protein
VPDEKKPDWKALVRERLNLAELSSAQQDELITELASHLDELCEKFRAQGLSQSEAAVRATREVPDWRGLAKTIQRVKREEGSMNTRTKHLWLPGFVTLAVAVLFFAASIRLNHPYIFHARYADVIFDFHWLLSLPLCGAAGAYLSRRAGGSRVARLACSLFPAGVMFVSMVCIILLTHVFGTDGAVSFPALPTIISTMILLPGASSLLGALPFLSTDQPRQSEALS